MLADAMCDFSEDGKHCQKKLVWEFCGFTQPIDHLTVRNDESALSNLSHC